MELDVSHAGLRDCWVRSCLVLVSGRMQAHSPKWSPHVEMLNIAAADPSTQHLYTCVCLKHCGPATNKFWRSHFGCLLMGLLDIWKNPRMFTWEDCDFSERFILHAELFSLVEVHSVDSAVINPRNLISQYLYCVGKSWKPCLYVRARSIKLWRIWENRLYHNDPFSVIQDHKRIWVHLISAES